MPHNYHLAVKNDGRWLALAGAVSRAYADGYLDRIRCAEAPQLAWRVVRSDGQVVREEPARDEVIIGVHAGMPTWRTIARAAGRALERAARTPGSIDEPTPSDRLRELVSEIEALLAREVL